MRTTGSDRRSFMAAATAATLMPAAAAAATAKRLGKVPAKLPRTPISQPPLPYVEAALEPVISSKTVQIHYGKHHKGYADKVIAAVKGTPLADASLEEVVVAASKSAKKVALFNAAGQLWNHNFYWQSLSPKAQTPGGSLAKAIDRDFGSLEACSKALIDASVDQFASGWGWLVSDRGKLKVVSTSNADSPFLYGLYPLLTVDVWEHAYYLDYQNRRPDHVSAVVSKTLNWDFAQQNYERSMP